MIVWKMGGVTKDSWQPAWFGESRRAEFDRRVPKLRERSPKSRSQTGLRRFRDGERRASAVTNL